MPEDFHKRRSHPDAAPDFLRPLGCGEHFFHLYAQVYPAHFCLCAEIEGAVGTEALRRALGRVRDRHPILRTRIVEDDVFGTAFHRSDRPIPLDTIAVAPAADWRPTVEHELQTPMGMEGSVLLRVTALRAPETTQIILTFHHAIADAMSAVSILHDVMCALAGAPLAAFRDFRPIEDSILGLSPPADLDGKPGRIMSAASEPPAPAIAPAGLRTHLATAELSQDETTRLIERCRVEGTTVHSALCAAAARNASAADREFVRINSLFDLRRMAGIDSGACGIFIGVGSLDVPTGGKLAIWPDARRIGARLAEARSPEAATGFIRWMTAEFPPTARREKLQGFLAAPPQSALVVSNLGILPIADWYGPYGVTAVWGPAMLTNLPADRQTLGVCTFGGRLRIVHQAYLPIQGLAAAIRRSLIDACG